MKKYYLCYLLFFITGISLAQSTDLFFSMYGEGSGVNKFLEIYNGTGAPINLDDYSVERYNNGSTSVTATYTFPVGTVLNSGDVYVLYNGSADAQIINVGDDSTTIVNFSGDDAVVLLKNGSILDIIGEIGNDPGSSWPVGSSGTSQNHTLIRKATVCSPNPIPLASFGTDDVTSEWEVYGENEEWGQLGSFSGCSSTPYIAITNPIDGMLIPAGNATVSISFTVLSFNVATVGNGDGHINWSVNNVPQPMKYDVSDETIDVEPDTSYTVYVELVDDADNPIVPAANYTVTFITDLPCDLSLTNGIANCDSTTSAFDTYTVTIDFTGGATTTYSITVNDGIVGGDNPSTTASGTITIFDITEGTDLDIEISGDPLNSSCTYAWTIDSPECWGNITCANPGDIIITEIMQNPSFISEDLGEYFEIYNTTDSDINMEGWMIRDSTDPDEDFQIIALTVPAHSYAVFGSSADTSINGGYVSDYVLGPLYYLANLGDDIVIDCGGTVIDQVAYDSGPEFPDPEGISMELATNAYSAEANDLGSNWGEATSTFGSGQYGTPGIVNDFLDTPNFGITTFSIYPNPVINGKLFIKSNTGTPVQAQLYNQLGRKLLNTTIKNDYLNVSTLPKGIYLLKLTVDGVSKTEKIVIK